MTIKTKLTSKEKTNIEISTNKLNKKVKQKINKNGK